LHTSFRGRRMTVLELILALQHMPPEADVKIDADKYVLDCEGLDLRADDEGNDQFVLLWGM
jgi:hypothetical protein